MVNACIPCVGTSIITGECLMVMSMREDEYESKRMSGNETDTATKGYKRICGGLRTSLLPGACFLI